MSPVHPTPESAKARAFRSSGRQPRSSPRRSAATASPASPPPPSAPVLEEACDVLHLDPAKYARVRAALMPNEDVAALAETFRVLGDPSRVQVLDALSKEELCVCDLASLLGLSQSAASHQLRVLRGMRLVRARRAGRMVFYALDDHHILSLFDQGLQHVQEAAVAVRPLRQAL